MDQPRDSAEEFEQLSRLVVGIGSHHGTDQLGWLAANQIAIYELHNVVVEAARTPIDLVSLLQGNSWAALHVIDACQLVSNAGRVHRLSWPLVGQGDVRFSGSHDFSLLAALELAAALNLLPPQVIVWAVEVPVTGDDTCDSSQTLVGWGEAVANRIAMELQPYTNFASRVIRAPHFG